MKKYLFILLFSLPVLFSSCSVTKKVSNSRTSENNSPKFLDGVWVSPNHKVSTSSKNNKYEKPSAIKGSSRRPENITSSATPLQYKYASLLDVAPTDITDVSLMRLIDDWYGTPYEIGGHSKDGIDCSGFSQMLLNNAFGETIPRTAQQQYDNCKHIKKGKLQTGDLVFFHTLSGGYITHVGVYLQNNKFVHASSHGVMISDLNDNYWRKAYRASGRVNDTTNDDE